MRFADLVRADFEGDADAVSRARDVLRTEAADFLRAGGTISIADWSDMSEAGRAEFLAASAIVDDERAAARALALARAASAAVSEWSVAQATKNAADAALRTVETRA